MHMATWKLTSAVQTLAGTLGKGDYVLTGFAGGQVDHLMKYHLHCRSSLCLPLDSSLCLSTTWQLFMVIILIHVSYEHCTYYCLTSQLWMSTYCDGAFCCNVPSGNHSKKAYAWKVILTEDMEHFSCWLLVMICRKCYVKSIHWGFNAVIQINTLRPSHLTLQSYTSLKTSVKVHSILTILKTCIGHCYLCTLAKTKDMQKKQQNSHDKKKTCMRKHQ